MHSRSAVHIYHELFARELQEVRVWKKQTYFKPIGKVMTGYYACGQHRSTEKTEVQSAKTKGIRIEATEN